VVDTQASGGSRFLYVNPGWPPGGEPSLVKRVALAGREVELRYALRPTFYQTEGRNLGWVVLLGGLAVSFSLAGLVWSLAGTRRRAMNLAQEMNASLYEALQRNRSHLDSTPLAVIETDSDFRVREWNRTAERVFGYTREDVLGQDPRLLIPQEHQAEVEDRRQAMLGSEAGSRSTMENLTRTGQRILCDWYGSALRGEDGRFIGTILLAEDVTDRRRAESALRQAQKLESLGVLAGGIAHDFNNLLTAILGNTELALERAQDSPPLRAALQRIEAATQRGADLARQLLAYAGKAPFAVRPLDLNALIREMSELLSVSINKKVTLRTDLQPDLPAVEADSAQFQQVVMNLVTNASEAIGERMGTVTLRTRAVTYSKADLVAAFPGQVLDPGRYVRLEVQDDGCGMDAETIGRIFDPFFTTKFTGRGLGLSAMLGIVRGHRAGLRVESATDQGTTFILLFPASDAALEPAQPLPKAGPSTTGTILVVDDEGIIRELARGALEGAGFQVLEARDGLEAVQVFEKEMDNIQLVLLDMTMPRMGGAEAFRRIRGLSPTCTVLLTSGYTQKESLESLFDLVPDGFLQKPFRIRELVAKVREILRDPGAKNKTK
jgi:PAS domain S-box-containing protein